MKIGHIWTILLVLGATAPAVAEQLAPAVAPPAPAISPVRLEYSAYVAGFNVMNVQAGVELAPDRYGIGLHVKTAGAVGMFVTGDTRTRVEGGFRGAAIVPGQYKSAGIWRGDPHIVDITYDGDQPVVHTLIPSNKAEEREPVPPELQRGTVDAVSAIALLMHAVATTGKCEGQTTTYDGRRVSKVTVRTLGQDVLPVESRSSFSGPALHCEIQGNQLAGFPRDAGPDDYSRRPQAASVWMASVTPGAPMVPVLMSFPTKLMGHMTLYLTQANKGVNFAEFTPHTNPP